MTWNRPHRLQLNVDWRFGKGDRLKIGGLTLPDRWGANFFYTLRSGRAYTPTNDRGERTGKRNSENVAFESVLDMKMEKSWALGPENQFAITFEARNLFNNEIVRVVDSSTGEKPQIDVGRYSHLTSDQNRDVVAQRLQDPAYLAEGRNLRLGLEVSF